jgi:3-isopropylmalate dehydrogenase
MLLRYSLGLEEEAKVVESAVVSVLEEGYRTADIVGPGEMPTSTSQMGNLVAARIGEKKG